MPGEGGFMLKLRIPAGLFQMCSNEKPRPSPRESTGSRDLIYKIQLVHVYDEYLVIVHLRCVNSNETGT